MRPWQKLNENGVEGAEYIPSPRHETRQLFSHEPKRILDIGCARGHVGISLKEDYNAYVWGVELNTLAAGIAGESLDKITTYPIEQFTAEDIALLKTMDTILLLDVVEHMYNPWQALVFLSEHAAPDAQIILSIPNVSHGSVLRDLAAGQWQYKNMGLMDVTHIRFFTPDEMLHLLMETGLRPEVWSYLMYGLNTQAPVDIENPSSYPFWLDLGGVKLEIRDKAHWMATNAVQLVFRAKIDKSVQPMPRKESTTP